MNLFLHDMNKSFGDLYKAVKINLAPKTSGAPAAGAPKAPGSSKAPGAAGAPKAPGSSKAPGAAGGTLKFTDCPFGGGSECQKHGGNGAPRHKVGGKEMQLHQEAMASKTAAKEPKAEKPEAEGIGGVGEGSSLRNKQLSAISSRAKKKATGPKEEDIGTADTQEMPATEGKPSLLAPSSSLPKTLNLDEDDEPKKEDIGTADTQEMPAVARTAPDPSRRRQDTPNPLSAENAPADSKPMDHYRLAQVAKELGDTEEADKHENLAIKRTDGWTSEQHKELADQLKAEGMADLAGRHYSIHEKVNAPPAEEPAKPAEEVSSASTPSSEAKEKNAETGDKAKKLAEKLKQKKQKPQKEPETEAEKLRHETHTDRAKDLAEAIKSHLDNNTELSDKDRKRAERAHAISMFHSDLKHVPTAAHKAELSEAEKAAKELGVHEAYRTPGIAELDDLVEKKKQKESKAEAKKQAGEAKAEAKKQAGEAKAEAKKQAAQPKEPESELDHAKMHDHKGRAETLRDSVQSHLDNNPNLSDSEKEKARRMLGALEEHTNTDKVPSAAQSKALKELEKMAGDMKKPYSESEEDGGYAGGGGGEPPNRTASSSLFRDLLDAASSGYAGSAGMAQAAVSERGAGQLGQQTVNYGITGAIASGHSLLHGVGNIEPRYKSPSVPNVGDMDEQAAESEEEAIDAQSDDEDEPADEPTKEVSKSQKQAGQRIFLR
ncbi:MAG: hypothetical protein EBS53_00385 [Bacteroidetes bacterium]|nr:hypothetical protein [Bacteroidota bacterium]